MTDTKFTKGEWKIDLESDWHECAITAESRVNKVDICALEIDFDGAIGIEQKSNAHLIASAPDMYKMLDQISIGMHKTSSGSIADILAIEALLKKARGE